MNYEVLYKEALERARALKNGEDVDVEAGTTTCEYIFPELKESEDEKVRKTLTRVLNENIGNGIEKYGAKLEDALAWLEKQKSVGEIVERCKAEMDYCFTKMMNGEKVSSTWSEEDKGNLLDVKCIIDEVWHNQNVREEIDRSSEELESLWRWLDSIWQRVEYPQATWKPTEEQLRAVQMVGNSYRPFEKEHKTIFSLYNDLKKLKGE